MADHSIPEFHNDIGVDTIQIGAKKFKCIGATAPFDHPHIFLDMGEDNEIVCPYCSTLFKHNTALKSAESEPAECS